MADVIDLVYDKTPVNPARLQEELAAVLGLQFVGVSTGPNGLRVHIQNDMSAANQAKIAGIVAAHDASQLSTTQQAEADQQTALDALRKPWDQWTGEDQGAFIRLLAEQMGLIPAE
jgi:hypothetical protein